MRARAPGPDRPSPRGGARNERQATSRASRLGALADARRDLILAAARSAFAELGLEGASLREIAKRAGYTAGAIYGYFQSKEDIYAALLAESLDRLDAAVVAAASGPAGRTGPAQLLRLRAQAFYDFYREHPRDLDLGFYLFQGMQPRGLTPDWNRRLNERLWGVLRPQQEALVALGFGPDVARTEVTGLFAQTVGLLLLSHTGRIRMFGRQSRDVLDRYLDQLIDRAPARHLEGGGDWPHHRM
ncbi:MAG TPA: helix-turn-helix domain-containing protein [Burkholderiaceae bacterium]|nr:helix-turn-helix domain-containing protein [Burkholderiaceae bacterium]